MGVDRLDLYRWAVQDPETHVAVLSYMYNKLRGRDPRLLREDFAGTSAESVAWVASGAERRALAVDHDPATLAWARRRAERLLLKADLERLQLIEGDVLQVAPPRVPAADVIAALNFGVFFFHRRAELLDYFRHAHRALAEQGILVFNLFGGPGSMRPARDQRRVEAVPRNPAEVAPSPFDYGWEQRSYDAMTGRIDCRIHFASSDDAPERFLLQDAFHYDWRVWTLPELIELVSEAGFADVQVWRHTVTQRDGKLHVFLGPVKKIENEDTWLAYVIAVR